MLARSSQPSHLAPSCRDYTGKVDTLMNERRDAQVSLGAASSCQRLPLGGRPPVGRSVGRWPGGQLSPPPLFLPALSLPEQEAAKSQEEQAKEQEQAANVSRQRGETGAAGAAARLPWPAADTAAPSLLPSALLFYCRRTCTSTATLLSPPRTPPAPTAATASSSSTAARRSSEMPAAEQQQPPAHPPRSSSSSKAHASALHPEQPALYLTL